MHNGPYRIPEYILPQELQDSLFKVGHGTSPDVIYTRGVPDTMSPDPSIFDRKKSKIILIDIGF